MTAASDAGGAQWTGLMRARTVLAMRGLLVALCGALASAPALAKPRSEPIIVFAAASLTDALQQIADAYTRQTGTPVKLSFAGSSALARQIEAGAGADVFVSADQEWMDYLAEHDLIVRNSRIELLGNRLALIAPRDSKVRIDLSRTGSLLAALGAGGRLAVAEPDAVPAGKYAKAALQSLGVWRALEPRLARAENVRVALSYVARGETPLGVVYATDARVEPRVRIVRLLPASAHPPITYPAALTRHGGAAAQRFVAFLRAPEARKVFQAAGFAMSDSAALGLL